MNPIKRLWKNPWVRFSLLVFLAVALIELAHIGWFLYKVKDELGEFTALRDQLLPKKVEKTCPREKYKTHSMCFREIGKSFLTRSWDTTGTILLLSIGVMVSLDDKAKGRCSQLDCPLNLLEIILDTTEPLIRKRAASHWSIYIDENVERAITSKFAVTFFKQTDPLVADARRMALSVKDPLTISRLQKIQDRYQTLRPLVQGLK